MQMESSPKAGNISAYCPVRRGLEERVWFMGDRLCELSKALMNNVGGSRFGEIKGECEQAREQVAGLRETLSRHRQEHRC